MRIGKGILGGNASTELNMDLVGVNANLNALGVVTPESGTGIHNTYYIQRGSTAFRKINGICFLYFDITIISTNTEDTILITNLPWCSMSVYHYAVNADTDSRIIFYTYGSELRCGAGEAGRYFGYIVYPAI